MVTQSIMLVSQKQKQHEKILVDGVLIPDQ